MSHRNKVIADLADSSVIKTVCTETGFISDEW